MGVFDKMKFSWDSIGAVSNHIQKWEPKNCKTEKQYENSLYAYLHEKMPGLQITKQYARGRIRADLMVEDKVIIELKTNLNSTAKYQRLIGQLMTYKEWKGKTIVLLTGDTDPHLRKELDVLLEREGLAEDLLETNLLVIQK